MMTIFAPFAILSTIINFVVLIGIIYFAIVVVKGITSIVESNKHIESQLNRLIDIQNEFLKEIKKDSN